MKIGEKAGKIEGKMGKNPTGNWEIWVERSENGKQIIIN